MNEASIIYLFIGTSVKGIELNESIYFIETKRRWQKYYIGNKSHSFISKMIRKIQKCLKIK